MNIFGAPWFMATALLVAAMMVLLNIGLAVRQHNRWDAEDAADEQNPVGRAWESAFFGALSIRGPQHTHGTGYAVAGYVRPASAADEQARTRIAIESARFAEITRANRPLPRPRSINPARELRDSHRETDRRR